MYICEYIIFLTALRFHIIMEYINYKKENAYI